MSPNFLGLACAGAIALAAAAVTSGQDAKKIEQGQSVADQIAAVVKESKDREQKFFEELSVTKDDARMKELNQEFSEFTQKQSVKLKALIQQNIKDPMAFEGILELTGSMRQDLNDDMVDAILKFHLTHAKIGEFCSQLAFRIVEAWPEKVLRAVADKHPQRNERGIATYALGVMQRNRATPWDKKLSEADEIKQFAEAERYFREVIKTYGDVQSPNGGKLGELAAKELVRVKNAPFLRVGKVAPEISGEDIDGKPFKLSDYRGKVVLLDFWGHW